MVGTTHSAATPVNTEGLARAAAKAGREAGSGAGFDAGGLAVPRQRTYQILRRGSNCPAASSVSSA